jgi:glycosyltransferase involved in cell wall biosynthesis
MNRNRPGRRSAPKRILYVEGNTDGTVGGSYFSLLLLASRLDRNRFQPVVVFATDNELIPRFRSAGIETMVRRPQRPIAFRWPAARFVAKFLNFILGAIVEPGRLVVLMRRERVALVHLNNGIIKNHAWMVAAWIARLPCVSHERGINAGFLPRARLLARSLDAVICISGAVHRSMLANDLGHLPLMTIHNGLDVDEMRVTRAANDIRAELGLNPGSRLIGMIGHIRAWKGQEILVKAMALLKDEFPDLVCLLVGAISPEEQWYQARLERQIDASGLAGRILITGNRPDVANYINALEIQVHASVAPEPFGRVLLEAMALSKPLVASRDGAVPEIVVDGATGMLFEPGNPVSLAACLRRLLLRPAEALAMGQEGRRRLEQSFSVKKCTMQVESVYEGLLY